MIDLGASFFRLRAFNPDLPNQERELLLQNRIWFGGVRNMDDIFEGRPNFVVTDDSLDRGDLLTMARKIHPELSEEERAIEVEKIVEANAIPLVRRFTMGNFIRGLELLYGSSSICCFTRGVPGQRQWDTYGNKGRGYSLVFDLSSPWRMQSTIDGDAIDAIPHRVNYVSGDRRPTIDVSFRMGSTDDNWEEVQSALLTKSADWDDLIEYRFLRIGLSPDHVEFPEESLVGIAFGYAIEDRHKHHLLELVGQRNRPVELFETVPSRDRFAVDFVPLRT